MAGYKISKCGPYLPLLVFLFGNIMKNIKDGNRGRIKCEATLIESYKQPFKVDFRWTHLEDEHLEALNLPRRWSATYLQHLRVQLHGGDGGSATGSARWA